MGGKGNFRNVQHLIESSVMTTAEDDKWKSGEKDMQGIFWKEFSYSRVKFRKDRLDHLLENVPPIVKHAKRGCDPAETGWMYYSFAKYDCCSMLTEQYYKDSYNAGMLWATSNEDVYMAANYNIGHCSASTAKETTILNLEGHVAPSEQHAGSHMKGFSKTRVCAMSVRDKLLVVGGNEGQLICKHLDRPGVSFCFQPTLESQGRINAIETYKHASGAIHFMASGQEGSVKDFDAETFQLSRDIRFSWQVNHASATPDGKRLVIVGDDPEGKLVDSINGKIIASFRGHLSYSCSSAWHPNGLNFATGNKDRTCRIWDVRNLSQSVTALEGQVRAINSLCFTPDGEFMAMGEDVDYVHVYSVKDEFERKQEIDFFGHVYGLCFSPDAESLFIGVSMDTCPTFLKYNRNRNDPLFLEGGCKV